MRKLLLTLLVILLAFSNMQAQEDADISAPITIEELVNNAEDYYGQRISIQGHVQNLLNVRTVVLAEQIQVVD